VSNATNRRVTARRGASVAHIDSAILNVTESCCRKLQVLTGRTNVWLAVQLTNLSIVIYFVWAGTFVLGSDPVTRGIVGAFCAGLLYLLTQTVFKVSIEASENNAYRRVANGFRNPRRVRDALLRILFLVLCVVLLGPVLIVYVNLQVRLALLSYSLIVLTTILLYVVACDPLPPCTGKLRQWLAALAPRSAAPATDRAATAPGPAERRLR
jgi:hypothetical protein